MIGSNHISLKIVDGRFTKERVRRLGDLVEIERLRQSGVQPVRKCQIFRFPLLEEEILLQIPRSNQIVT